LLLCGIGLIALQTATAGDWSSSTPNQCSVFTIGRIMLERLKTTVARSMAAVIDATEQAVPNWG
ncbi:MAG TPA: hypothetical protein VNL70_01475, partial [Tepidisphaeraceae bacterium]|nr:hypothetical protein [Tepidisphaeraceae bacterium]